MWAVIKKYISSNEDSIEAFFNIDIAKEYCEDKNIHAIKDGKYKHLISERIIACRYMESVDKKWFDTFLIEFDGAILKYPNFSSWNDELIRKLIKEFKLSVYVVREIRIVC